MLSTFTSGCKPSRNDFQELIRPGGAEGGIVRGGGADADRGGEGGGPVACEGEMSAPGGFEHGNGIRMALIPGGIGMVGETLEAAALMRRGSMHAPAICKSRRIADSMTRARVPVAMSWG